MFKQSTRYALYKIFKRRYIDREDYKLFVTRFENRFRIIFNYYAGIFKTKNVVPFFVLGAPRTGSTLLVDYLDNIENVECLHEILNFRMAIGVTRDFTREKALKHIKYSIYNGRSAVSGAKLFFWQLNFFGIEIADIQKIFPNAKYIVIYRKSLIDQYVSLMLARKTGKWANTPFQGKIVVNPDNYKTFCTNTKNDYNRILNDQIIKSRSIVTAYEDIANDAQHEFDTKISSFLGIKNVRLKTRFKKQNTKNLIDVIENYAEVSHLIENEISFHSYCEPEAVNVPINSITFGG